MKNEIQTLWTWLTPASFLVGALLFGWVFEKFVMTRLKKLAAKTTWNADEIIVQSFQGTTFYLFLLGGVYGAAVTSPLELSYFSVIEAILTLLLIVCLVLPLSKATGSLVADYSQSKQLPSATIFVNLSRAFVLILGFVMILHVLGIAITPLLTALGVGGLAVALALQDTLSNFFAGLQLLGSGKVKLGDYIKLESGEEGYVSDITWRNTSVRALANNMFIIPNAKLSSSIFTNYNRPGMEMSVIVQVGVGYGSDLAQVEEVTVEVAKEIMKEIEGGVPSYQPMVRFHTFGDSSINFSVILRAKEFVNQFLLKHEFIKRLHKRYETEGIEIPFPIRTVYMKQERNGDQ